MKMKCVFLYAASALLICLAGPAAAELYPASVVLRPQTMCPAIVGVEGKDNVTVEVAEKYSVSDVELSDASGTAVKLSGGNDGACAGKCVFKIPEGAHLKAGLYDLKTGAVKEGSTEKLSVLIPRSVWVREEGNKEITFALVSDPHVGDPRASLSPSVETPTERRIKVYRAAAASGADFILLTGDIVSVPGDYVNEYAQAYRELTENIKIPVFAAPGNHDLYSSSPTAKSADGLNFWRKYFGPDHYEFNVDGFDFIVMNTYNWPLKYRNFMNQSLMESAGSYQQGAVGRKQYEWLSETLARASGAKKKIICVGHHTPPGNLAKTNVEGIVKPADVFELLKKYNIEAFIAGHVHTNTDSNVDGIREITTTSASSHVGPGGDWGYKLCKTKDSELTCSYIKVIDSKDMK